MIEGHFEVGKRGYALIYNPARVNYCPGCGRSNWHVGRHVAECAFCTTALPLRSENHPELVAVS